MLHPCPNMAIDSAFFTSLDIPDCQFASNSPMSHVPTHLSAAPGLLHLVCCTYPLLFFIFPSEFTIESDNETSSVGSDVDRIFPAYKSPPVFNADSSTSTTSPPQIAQWTVATNPSYCPHVNITTTGSLLLGTYAPFCPILRTNTSCKCLMK